MRRISELAEVEQSLGRLCVQHLLYVLASSSTILDRLEASAQILLRHRPRRPLPVLQLVRRPLRYR